MLVMRRLYLNKYVETLFQLARRCNDIFSRISLVLVETVLLVPKSSRNKAVLFVLLSLCTRFNQSEDVERSR